MFKSLLRTLPTLSGNFTLCCNIDNIYKDSSNEYHALIKTANIIPLQNNMFRKPIIINLLNGRYEFDVSKFYYLYNNVFYKENFSYPKDDYFSLNLTSNYVNNDARNKDYEFGCKRIQYSQNNYQFNFYAPIYINNENDLPEYFEIEINLNDHLSKTLKVYINKSDSENYLKQYLIKYIKQIDDKVIYFLPGTKQASYFGIDVQNGGLKGSIDNVIGNIFDSQHTINNFDYTICQGFERNKMIMEQIIPLSFSFNINDLFNSYEKEFFKFSKIKILGHYYNKLNIRYDFYDYSIDYYDYYHQYNKYNEELGKFEISNGYDNDIINVMNVKYPSLNEGRHTRYRFSNKLTPIYCRFKMLHSSDEDPYIINLSYGYSHLQYPNIKYGYFPTTFKNIIPKLIISKGDIKLPIGKNKNDFYIIKETRNNITYIDTSNLDKFNKLMSNYCSNWFYPYKSSYDNLDNIINDENIWSNVNHNYAYLNGVLYNFNNSSQQDKIDKFTVLLNVNIDVKNKEELNEIRKANIVLSHSDDSGIPICDYNNSLDKKHNKLNEYNSQAFSYNSLYNLNANNKAYIKYNECMKKDDKGNYIIVDNYNKVNKYYKYSDLEKIFLQDDKLKDYVDLLKNEQVNGYILLDGINNINYFESYKEYSGKKKIRLMLWDEIFDTNSIRSKYYWLVKKLYCSNIRSTKKVLIKSIYKEISSDENSYGKIAVYLKESLIDINYFMSILLPKITNNALINKLHLTLSKLNSYEYVPYSNDYGIDLKDYFVKTKNNYKDIYVDTFNINKYIKQYNQLYGANLRDANSYNKKEYFVSIKNKEHLKTYFNDLCKDENGISTILMDDIFDVIYAKQRIWNISDNNMDAKDVYYPLSSLIRYVSKNDDKYNVEKFNWFIKHISEVRNTSNKFVFNCKNINDEETSMELDLCYKKKFIKLDNNLYKLLKDNKYLYLYVEDDCKTQNIDIWNKYSDAQLNSLDSSVIVNDINNFLMPLYTYPYSNINDINNLKNFIENSRIKDCKIKEYDDVCFKEIDIFSIVYNMIKKSYMDNFIEFFKHYENEFISSYVVDNNIELNEETNDYDFIYKLKFINESYNDIFYDKLVHKLCKIDLYSPYDILNLSYTKFDNEIDGYSYDDNLKINIYEKNGIRYGLYIISLNIDNTNNSFYINNDYGMNIIFNTINDKPINNETIMNNIKILYHFFKINIFNEFANTIKLIVFPTENNIKIRYASIETPKDEEYKYINLKKDADDIIYNDIKILKKDRNIKLLRYFNYIEPLLKKTTKIVNSFEHKFKTNDIYFNIENNILNRSSLNIYRYNPLCVCTNFEQISNLGTYEYVNQLEYKHFNDNELYNLKEEIIIEENSLVTYEKTIELQNNDNLLKIFKKYIKLKNDNGDLSLFLFNKYKVDFISTPHILSANKSEKLYKVTYKFILI